MDQCSYNLRSEVHFSSWANKFFMRSGGPKISACSRNHSNSLNSAFLGQTWSVPKKRKTVDFNQS